MSESADAALADGPGPIVIRPATEGDLEALVGFEIEIAVISFADEAITDPALHRRRVSGALGKPGEVTLVAVAERDPGAVLGWAWLSGRTNSLTGAKYGNFRSLAVADVPGRSLIGELLLGAVLAAADEGRLTSLTGKVHAGNLGMRALYRKFGFTATHLTMERRQDPGAEPGIMIKCVVWDIDNTLLAGTYLESGDRLPPPDPELLGVLRELADRGIVHALASKNPPAAADYVADATGLTFAAAECGWGRKSDAVRRILDDLGVAADAVAFVDDDLMERAEVAASLPDVLVLSPEDAVEAPAWPEFRPAVLTAEGRRRGELYAQRRHRQEEARAFGGSRDDFLRQAGTQVDIGPATRDDLPRLHELSVRTHQLNNSGEPVSIDELAGLLGLDQHVLAVVRLRDRFGDDGLVGGAVIERSAGQWTATLLMMSCRALGRGVLEALLAALSRQAAADGAAELRVPCLVTDRNVPLRLALAAAGFRAAAGKQQPGEPVLFARQLAGPPPALPDWAAVQELS